MTELGMMVVVNKRVDQVATMSHRQQRGMVAVPQVMVLGMMVVVNKQVDRVAIMSHRLQGGMVAVWAGRTSAHAVLTTQTPLVAQTISHRGADFATIGAHASDA